VVTEAVKQASTVDEEESGHLQGVGGRTSDSVREKGEGSSQYDFGPEELIEFAALQAEGAVEAPAGVGDAVDVREAVFLQDIVQCRRVSHVNQDDAGSGFGDGPAQAGEVGYRFTTERAARVAQENEEDGRLLRERDESFTGFRYRAFERFGEFLDMIPQHTV
jgi:hypothetical protein